MRRGDRGGGGGGGGESETTRLCQDISSRPDRNET